MTKLEQAAALVAQEFKATMAEGEFDTFNEMARCYRWESSDIKDEVDAILRDLTAGEVYIDEDDGSMVFAPDGEMEYRKFSAMWRKQI